MEDVLNGKNKSKGAVEEALVEATRVAVSKSLNLAKIDAFKLWEKHYGDARFAEDFHGYLMCRDGYGNPNFFIKEDGEAIYCGWNIHHILPKNCGGTNAISNLTCTNIVTNDEAADKITFWIDDCLYQVQRTCDGHGIFQLN